ncbi:hypothetical protein ACHAXS_010141 [Conticribra weissflogii]
MPNVLHSNRSLRVIDPESDVSYRSCVLLGTDAFSSICTCRGMENHCFTRRVVNVTNCSLDRNDLRTPHLGYRSSRRRHNIAELNDALLSLVFANEASSHSLRLLKLFFPSRILTLER